jgi:hypothetical protein
VTSRAIRSRSISSGETWPVPNSSRRIAELATRLAVHQRGNERAQVVDRQFFAVRG